MRHRGLRATQARAKLPIRGWWERRLPTKNRKGSAYRPSSLEQAWAHYWTIWGTTREQPVPEFPFAPPARFRADFAFQRAKVLVEIEGGTWTNGRHNRGAGMSKDAHKYNLAALRGYIVLRYTSDMLQEDPFGCIQQVVTLVERRLAA